MKLYAISVLVDKDEMGIGHMLLYGIFENMHTAEKAAEECIKEHPDGYSAISTMAEPIELQLIASWFQREGFTIGVNTE